MEQIRRITCLKNTTAELVSHVTENGTGPGGLHGGARLRWEG
jgi:hypothetical protein